MKESIFRERIIRSRKVQAVGLTVVLATFFFIPVFQPLMLITIIGIMLIAVALWRTKQLVKCPNCGHSLGYLLFDSSYSKTFSYWLLPRDIPEDVRQCPFCQYNIRKS